MTLSPKSATRMTPIGLLRVTMTLEYLVAAIAVRALPLDLPLACETNTVTVSTHTVMREEVAMIEAFVIAHTRPVAAVASLLLHSEITDLPVEIGEATVIRKFCPSRKAL